MPGVVRGVANRPTATRRRSVLSAGMVLVVVAMVLAVGVMVRARHAAVAVGPSATSATPTGSSGSSIRDEPLSAGAVTAAVGLSGLLNTSGSQRAVQADAISCASDISRSRAQLWQVFDGTQGLQRRLAALDVEALPGGAALRRDLTQAWWYSLEADREYLAWAQTRVPGRPCLTTTPAYLAGQNRSQAGRAARDRFVHRWNIIARRCDLATVSPDAF